MHLATLFPTDPEDPEERPRCPACGSKAKRAKDYNYERIYRCPAQGCRIWIKED